MVVDGHVEVSFLRLNWLLQCPAQVVIVVLHVQVTEPAQAAQPIQAAQPVQSGQLVQAAQPASAGVTPAAAAAAVGSASVIQPPKRLVCTYI